MLRGVKKDGNGKRKKELEPKTDYDFTSLSADRESFDFTLWRRYIKSALRQDERLLSYGEAQGERELREALCKYITEHRNAVCSPDNIVIGAGVQSLLHIICAVLPAFAKGLFSVSRNLNRAQRCFPTTALNHAVQKKKADIIYVSPSHITASATLCRQVKGFALSVLRTEKTSLIIEDDYDS